MIVILKAINFFLYDINIFNNKLLYNNIKTSELILSKNNNIEYQHFVYKSYSKLRGLGVHNRQNKILVFCLLGLGFGPVL